MHFYSDTQTKRFFGGVEPLRGGGLNFKPPEPFLKITFFQSIKITRKKSTTRV